MIIIMTDDHDHNYDYHDFRVKLSSAKPSMGLASAPNASLLG